MQKNPEGFEKVTKMSLGKIASSREEIREATDRQYLIDTDLSAENEAELVVANLFDQTRLLHVVCRYRSEY